MHLSSGGGMPFAFDAEPYALEFERKTTALLIIDMQRDFLEPGGFGEMLGNDVSLLRAAIDPCKRILAAAREAGLLVMHTREGHRPDLADAPPTKLARGGLETGIGADGPMGRILVRGEPGHEIVPELAPKSGEPVIDKSGKGAFYETDLELMLRNNNIRTIIVCGVTTEVCVTHDRTRSQRPGLRVPGPGRLRRIVFSGISTCRHRHDQGPGRHLRMGVELGKSHRRTQPVCAPAGAPSLTVK